MCQMSNIMNNATAYEQSLIVTKHRNIFMLNIQQNEMLHEHIYHNYLFTLVVQIHISFIVYASYIIDINRLKYAYNVLLFVHKHVKQIYGSGSKYVFHVESMTLIFCIDELVEILTKNYHNTDQNSCTPNRCTIFNMSILVTCFEYSVMYNVYNMILMKMSACFAMTS